MAPAALATLCGGEQDAGDARSCVGVTGSESVQPTVAALELCHVLEAVGVAPALGAALPAGLGRVADPLLLSYRWCSWRSG